MVNGKTRFPETIQYVRKIEPEVEDNPGFIEQLNRQVTLQLMSDPRYEILRAVIEDRGHKVGFKTKIETKDFAPDKLLIVKMFDAGPLAPVD